jgi:hypothetical protein
MISPISPANDIGVDLGFFSGDGKAAVPRSVSFSQCCSDLCKLASATLRQQHNLGHSGFFKLYRVDALR